MKVMTDKYIGLGTNSTTSKFCHYHLFKLDHPEIIKLRSNLFKFLLGKLSEA